MTMAEKNEEGEGVSEGVREGRQEKPPSTRTSKCVRGEFDHP